MSAVAPLPLVDDPGVVPGSSEGDVVRFGDIECKACGTRLGVEAVSVIVWSVGRGEVVGWLHTTICKDVWYREHVDSSAAFLIMDAKS